jgi:hypothetical protein
MEYKSHEEMLISELTRTLTIVTAAGIDLPAITRLRSILQSNISDSEKFDRLTQWLEDTQNGTILD